MTIAVKINVDLDRRLTELAKKTNRSKSSYVREAVENYVDDLEDFYLGQAVLAANEPIYSAAEMRKMCGLDD